MTHLKKRKSILITFYRHEKWRIADKAQICVPRKDEILGHEETGGNPKVSFHCTFYFPNLQLHWPLSL